MEVFGNDYVAVLDTSKCVCFCKRWVRFQSGHFQPFGRAKTDAMFLVTEKKIVVFKQKTDMCGREMKLGTKWFQPSLNVSFLCFLTL